MKDLTPRPVCEACVRNATLVTHNTAEFGRVAGLRVEDWEKV